MSKRIKVYENNEKLTLGRALGSTTFAFNTSKSKELMREYTLSFSIANNDSVFKFINENSIFKYNGQLFDIAGIDGDSGTQNITQVAAEHISYRLSEYTVPDGYSFVGTVKQIAEDILAEAKLLDGTPANTVFSIGETVDIGIVSFGMHGSTNVTAREALIAMSKLGLEVDFDNFVINLPERLGTDYGIKFEYGVNLNGVHRTWQKNNGWSYEIKIVDLQKKTGYENYRFNLGDTITVYDSLANATMSKRIICYTECDDPRENRVTVGVFVRDNASLAIETDRIANNAQGLANNAQSTADSAQKTANNSVQQGVKYSNVSINHTDGFIATNRAGNQRVTMNADDCFAVQVLKKGEWVTVNALEDFGLLVDRLSSKDAKNKFYIKIGATDENNYGLIFFIDDEQGLLIESPNSEQVTISSPKNLNLSTTKVFNLIATAVGAISRISAYNLQISTSNLITRDEEKNIYGHGLSGKSEISLNVNGENHIGEFEVINGIVTKFPGMR